MASMTFVACTSAPDAKEAVTTSAKKVTETAQSAAKQITKGNRSGQINTEESRITFIGTKPTGRHEGYFKVSDGRLEVSEGKLKSGKFEIDMNSLTITDLEGKQKESLEGHLKSGDFFTVEKFPTAMFYITGVEKSEGENSHTIAGNLTIMGETQNVEFPADVDIQEDGTLSAKANFNIDRTKWGIKYGSEKSLGDKFIRPEVNISINLVSL